MGKRGEITGGKERKRERKKQQLAYPSTTHPPPYIIPQQNNRLTLLTLQYYTLSPEYMLQLQLAPLCLSFFCDTAWQISNLRSKKEADNKAPKKRIMQKQSS